VAEITARDLLALLRKIEDRGLYETARRLRNTCGMVFRYAVATGRAERDPSMDLRGALTAPGVAQTIVGLAVTTPRYPPSPPMYVGCYWTHGSPYWGGYGWVYPRVRVCE